MYTQVKIHKNDFRINQTQICKYSFMLDYSDKAPYYCTCQQKQHLPNHYTTSYYPLLSISQITT